jgi:hypothetical protein
MAPGAEPRDRERSPGRGPEDPGRKAVAVSAQSKGRARAGDAVREAIRNIYYSDRQLPPGHDPGADSGEAPTTGGVAHGH